MQLVRQMILALCSFGVAITARGESRQMESYRSIIDRNPFGLKDPPIVEKKETNAAPPVKKEDFYLTGISTIGNAKRPKAYLVAKDQTKKDYKDKYFNLTVGDRQGDVALKEVDEKGRRVKIEYLGEEKWLSMKDNGVPAPTGPAPGAPGMAPGAPMHNGNNPPPNGVPIPLPSAGGPAAAPSYNANPGAQPLSYPNAANITRRPIRSSTTGNSGNLGPQTDAELLKHIITAQNPELNRPESLPKNIPMPPVPGMPNLPGQ